MDTFLEGFQIKEGLSISTLVIEVLDENPP